MGTVTKRLVRGTKTVWKDKDGKERWDAKVYVGRDADGKPITKMRSFSTKRAADTWVAKNKVDKESGVGLVMACRDTLAEYMAEWLRLYTGVRPGTRYNLSKSLHKWVIDKPRVSEVDLMIGLVRMDKLTPGHFKRFYLALHQHMAKRGISHIHGGLKQALETAVTDNILGRNPLAKVKLPKDPDEDEDEDAELDHDQYMTLEQAQAFIKAGSTDRLSALWHLLIYHGLRPGEALALKWDKDIDLDKAEVHVRGTLSRLGLDKKIQKWIIGPPKTKASRRTLLLDPPVVAELRKWRTAQKKERLKAGKLWQDHGFAFTTEVGTPLDGSNLAGRAFRKVMEAAGLGERQFIGPEPKKPKHGPTAKRKYNFVATHRLYSLRHTYATLALEAGVPLEEVSANLGHTDLTFTAKTYAKVTRRKRERSVGILARALTGTG
jgi:integrase